MAPLEAELRVQGDIAVVALRGELDAATCPVADEELSRAEALRPAGLVIDLSELQFMGSTGARFLVEAHQRALAAGRRLGVLNGSGSPHRVIELLALQDFLRMIDDASELVRVDESASRGS
jgi:anti-sigma B factor antagonist